MNIFVIFLILFLSISAKADILVAKWDGAISPITADYVKRVVSMAESDKATAVILVLDTPGGLDTAMRDVIKTITNTPIPFVVYIYPKGARAASAGAIITVSADVAAMSPMSNIGSASPVGMNGEEIDDTMKKKIINDMVAFVKSVADEKGRNSEILKRMVTESVNLTAEEAVKQNVIDFIATDIDDLLKKLDGKKIKKLGIEKTINTNNQTVRDVELNFKETLLKFLSNPTIAYLLLMIGFYGIFFELYNPGSIVPGTVGAICLALALYSLNIISVNWLGLILIILGVLFLIIEVITPTFGGIAIAGIISLLIGSVILISPDSPYGDISLSIIVPTVILSAVFFLTVAYFGIKAQRQKPKIGRESVIGKIALAKTDIDKNGGYVLMDGELWKAISDSYIEKDKKVEIVEVDGLTLKVKKISEANDADVEC